MSRSYCTPKRLAELSQENLHDNDLGVYFFIFTLVFRFVRL